MSGHEGGQATVEVALTLPLLGALALVLLSVAVTAGRQVAVVEAARAAARAAAVSAELGAARQAATAAAPGLDPAALTVTERRADGLVTAEVTYQGSPAIPLVARLVPPIELRARATALDETARPP